MTRLEGVWEAWPLQPSSAQPTPGLGARQLPMWGRVPGKDQASCLWSRPGQVALSAHARILHHCHPCIWVLVAVSPSPWWLLAFDLGSGSRKAVPGVRSRTQFCAQHPLYLSARCPISGVKPLPAAWSSAAPSLGSNCQPPSPGLLCRSWSLPFSDSCAPRWQAWPGLGSGVGVGFTLDQASPRHRAQAQLQNLQVDFRI